MRRLGETDVPTFARELGASHRTARRRLNTLVNRGNAIARTRGEGGRANL